MGKTIKGKDKAARKTAAAKRKIERKTKGGKVAAIVAAFALAAILTGCATSDSAQPAKSQTQNNRFDDCVFIMAAQATVSNGVVVAKADGDTPPLEMFTQAQSLESTGATDTFGQTATQTPTTDIKPNIDVHYNDAIGTGGNAASAFLSSLTAESFAAVRDYIKSGKSGKVTVTKKDGTTETLDCADGTCTYSGGTITAKDCDACTDCAPK
ncbi:MAG: hypothetical protein J6Z49_06990 [Kiritimatiellae bacterium]|nr:hypothetical protein [Kiritimatiellia bacterium]